MRGKSAKSYTLFIVWIKNKDFGIEASISLRLARQFKSSHCHKTRFGLRQTQQPDTTHGLQQRGHDRNSKCCRD